MRLRGSRPVAFVSGSRRERIPLVMELTTESFPSVDDHRLQVGLADIFGELKVEESVPFLANHLILRRYPGADFAPWSKRDPVVLQTFRPFRPSFRSGRTHLKALIKEYAGAKQSEKRLAAIFVVAHIPGVPEAVEFLKSVSEPTGLEREYINTGLELQAR